MAGLLAGLALVAGPRLAHADPDGDEPAGIQPPDGVAAQIGQLSAQLTAADQDLRNASVTAELAIEKYQRAAVDEKKALQTYSAARDATVTAGRQVDQTQDAVGQLARRDYEFGGSVGAFAAFVGGRPSDTLRNLEYLRYVGDKRARSLQGYRVAKAKAILVEGDARQAYQATVTARQKASDAKDAAVTAVNQRQKNVTAIQARKAELQKQLSDIEASNAAIRQAAEEKARKEAEAREQQEQQADDATRDAQTGTGDAMVAVRAALTQLGKPYVWDAADPDVGFDCSGLALWAYAKIGIDLPHSAEYQYGYGWHPSSDHLRPGDLLFYSSNGTVGGIHHVTMYIGRGQIVEAADFGIPVHVIPAYFDFGYFGATRLVG